MTTAQGTQSEVNKILAAIKKAGYSTVPGGSGHRKVVDKQGRPVRDSNGPLMISSSPSDVRWRAMTVKRLMDAKVLAADPFESNQQKKANRPGANGDGEGKENPLTRAEVKEAKLRAIQKMTEERARKTRQLRELVEPVIVKLGGWDKQALGPGIAGAAIWYLNSIGWLGGPPTESAAIQSFRHLRLGNTLSDKSRDAWRRFFEELSKDPAGPLARYMELQRLSKGLPAKDPGPNVVEITPPGRRIQPKVVRQAAGVRPAMKKGLALEAVFYMAQGPDVDSAKVLSIGERILELELDEQWSEMTTASVQTTPNEGQEEEEASGNG